jgi:hypothetical protein
MPSAPRLNASLTTIPALALCALPLALASRSLPNGGSPQSVSQLAASRLTSIEIVLPPRLVADRPATLATLGADHRLIGHVAVELGNGARLQTDATGRVNFTAPSGHILMAKAGGSSAAALVDSPSAVNAETELSVPPRAALHSSLNLCGGEFDGNAEANRVEINDEPALVLAASPECLVVVPAASAAPGVAKISVDSDSPPREASVTLVSLDFEPPQLTPGKKGWLTVRARGSDQPLRVMVENESFDVLQFEKGDTQELTTSGGAQNVAQIQVQAIRSGDFSFHARILPPPDPEAARRFLQAAEPLALADIPRTLKKMEDEISHHPNDAEKIRAELDQMLAVTSPTEFRTLLEAARSSL